LPLALLPGCKRSAQTEDPGHPGRTRIALGRTPLWVEIADDPDTRTRGLMFRRAMPEDEGMLFVFEYAEPQSFWMKNTYLPLDIAFIGPDYRVLNILAMKPLDEGPRYNSAGAALYALEVNQGWCARHGVKPGDLLSFR
ncbi:MAG TPA: DUF192 domain-containing protein, partial [Candidatus Edwardsbacteria bacterium]|nr:DUF192 domain-containing protein [Candidatus Edwardsbacteria bacterium]